MQVILIENYRKLGKVGEVVKVKDGFARNFLIPNKKAILASESNKAFFAAKKAEIEKENSKKHEEAEGVSKKIDKKIVALIRQAAEDGRLYGSVTAQDIATTISEELKTDISRKQIILDKPVKTIGIFPITVNVFGDVFAKVNVNVARSDAEANDAAIKFKKGEYKSPADEAAAKKSLKDSIEVPAEEATEKKEETASEGEAA